MRQLLSDLRWLYWSWRLIRWRDARKNHGLPPRPPMDSWQSACYDYVATSRRARR